MHDCELIASLCCVAWQVLSHDIRSVHQRLHLPTPPSQSMAAAPASPEGASEELYSTDPTGKLSSLQAAAASTALLDGLNPGTSNSNLDHGNGSTVGARCDVNSSREGRYHVVLAGVDVSYDVVASAIVVRTAVQHRRQASIEGASDTP